MDERLAEKLDLLLLAVDGVAHRLARLEAELESYRHLLPEPGTIKARIARRRLSDYTG